MKLIGLILVLIFTCNSAYSQVSEPNILRAYRTNEKITLDGKFDEQSWSKAIKISNFSQREINNGAIPTEKTEVAVIYNDEAIYLAAWCWDSEADKITYKSMKRDCDYWLEDNFEILFDSFDDKRSGYLFVTTPLGSRTDVLIGDDGNEYNDDWNGVWDVETQITDKGWFAEFKFPLSSLKFRKDSIQEWGINFERNVRRKREQILWQGWSRDNHFEMPSIAGRLIGLQNIYPENSIEFKPFASAGAEYARGKSAKSIGKLGGDINYLVTPTLKLSATLNTDFAQVESDKAQVNLSRFSIFYPEKRDFFLEGKNFFEFGINEGTQLFYSRRIGIVDGQEIPIIAGARLLGKENNTNIGALSIQTGGKNSIEPANYTVVRLRQDVLNRSYIGFIFGGKFDNNSNVTSGIDAVFSQNLFGKNIIYGAKLAFTGDNNIKAKKNLSYVTGFSFPNDDLNVEFKFSGVQKNFKSEIGFLQRTNYKNIYSHIVLRSRYNTHPILKYIDFKPLNADIYWNDENGKLESFYYEVRPIGLLFVSNDKFEFNISRNQEALHEDFEIHDSISIPKGDYWFTRYRINASTFDGRKMSVATNIVFGDFFNGSRTQIWANFKYNINSNMNLDVEYDKNVISLKSGKFDIDELGGRFEYSFNPKLISSCFGQWNNDDKSVLLNFRIHWIFVVGSDFYLAINQRIGKSDNTFLHERTSIIGKLVWRIG